MDYRKVACSVALLPLAAWAEPQMVSPCSAQHYAHRIVQEFDSDILQMTQDQLAYDQSSEAELRRTVDNYEALGKLARSQRVREFERVVASPNFQRAGTEKGVVLDMYDVRVQDVRRLRTSGDFAAACEAAVAAKIYMQLARSYSRQQYDMLKARLDALVEDRPTSP